MIVLCYLIQHYVALQSLPDYAVDVYINSNTNTCKTYNMSSWEVVDRQDSGRGHPKMVITNGVIQVEGFVYENTNSISDNH